MSHFFFILRNIYPNIQNYELSTLNFYDDDILESLSISFIEEINDQDELLRFYCFDTFDKISEYIVTIKIQDSIISIENIITPILNCLIEVECIY